MKTFFAFLWSLLPNPHFTGVIKDSRSQFEKTKDYIHEEIASTYIASYNNPKILTAPYTLENQNQTSSCVPHGVTLATGNIYDSFHRLSKMFVYRQRSNYNQAGMWLQQAFEIIRKAGSCNYETLPDTINEAQANNVVLTPSEFSEALANKIPNEYYTIQIPNNIDTLCAVAEQGIDIPILVYGTNEEWSMEYPQILGDVSFDTAEVRHCICVIKNSGFIENRKKYLVIQDSAWFGGRNLRYLSEDFIKARVYGAAYWLPQASTTIVNKPKYHFILPLSYGSKGEEVVALQNVLIYEGLLPANLNTGNFLGRTQAAVKAFQEKYAADILTPVGLVKGTGYVGLSTLKFLNMKYSV